MRKIIISAGVLVLMSACNQKTAAPATTVASPVADLATENIKGNVTQVETDTYAVDSTGKQDSLPTKEFELYDTSGYTITYYTKNNKDSLKSKTEYTHNANGILTKQVTTDSTGKITGTLTLDTDSAGKYSLAKSYDSSGKMDAFYDSVSQNQFGEVLGYKGHHADSTVKGYYSNQYDSIYYVSGISKDSVGKLTYSGTVKLNDKKDAAELDETTVTKGVSKSTVTTYKYDTWDTQGNWTQMTATNEKGKTTKVVKRIITYK